jgi:hypothetical protein
MSPITTSRSKAALWPGRILSGVAILFLPFDCSSKLLRLPMAAESTAQLGYPAELALTIGIIEFVCLIVYVIPAASILGAVLFTGYLGGAIATHLRIGSPLFTHILFPIYIAALIWGGLYLRDGRVRKLVPLRD